MYTNLRLTALAAALACAAAPAGAEDLMQIYAQAREADPTFAIADSSRLVADGGADAARAALLPQISASLNYLHSDGNSRSIASAMTGQSPSVRRQERTRAIARGAQPVPLYHEIIDGTYATSENSTGAMPCLQPECPCSRS